MTSPFVAVDWLNDNAESDDVIVVDAQTVLVGGDPAQSSAASRAAYEAGHIPGAIFVDVVGEANDSSDLLFTRLSDDAFRRFAGDRGLDPSKHIVVYDQARDESGKVGTSKWAARLRWQLKAAGFPRTSVLEGGLIGWEEAGHPVAVGIETRPATVVTTTPAPTLFVDAEDVDRAIADSESVLIDSRAEIRYLGDDRQLAYRQGHIPTALHLDQADSLVPGTPYLRPVAELEELYSSRVADQATPIVSYCGGGVSSVWNALVLESLGYSDVAVYDGSILEWSRLDRELVTGPEPRRA